MDNQSVKIGANFSGNAAMVNFIYGLAPQPQFALDRQVFRFFLRRRKILGEELGYNPSNTAFV